MTIKKLTKKVWFEGCLWDVVEVFSPIENCDYILVKREECWDKEGEVSHVEMRLIDAHNENFYCNTKKVENLMEEWKRLNSTESSVHEKLSREWLNMFPR